MRAMPRGRGAHNVKRSVLATPVPYERAWLDELHAAGVLTAKQREVLLWRAQNFSYQAIAYGLKLDVSTVQRRVKRATQLIAIHLEAQASE
jgi:DNA-binding CsgD family transcriptional regulator